MHTLTYSPGYLPAILPPIPTALLRSGYHACFSSFHTHCSAPGWVSNLLFFLPYPLLCFGLGIKLAFLPPIPIALLRSGYQTYFSSSHTHCSAPGWVSDLLFFLPYPLLCSGLGITLAFLPSIPSALLRSGYQTCFSSSHTHCSALGWVSDSLFSLPYPLLCSGLGITPAFLSLMPTTLLWSGYHACFSFSHAHADLQQQISK